MNVNTPVNVKQHIFFLVELYIVINLTEKFKFPNFDSFSATCGHLKKLTSAWYR